LVERIAIEDGVNEDNMMAATILRRRRQLYAAGGGSQERRWLGFDLEVAALGRAAAVLGF
jgi:hypothetical protein